ncbi:hypothetical protein FFL01_25580 [Flavobacterium flevense]|uniref:AAA+ ATPase domain-containing protein n=1 Tax=Flavobacterium flevense TaxID=983 RepID=A0A4Y4B0A5_9FLAO|nr:AAA family ATPase [Flavobacterium flevense]GEC73019.1 hypothetical protein FFL01_25580 [Flavobacterium flevense]
MRLEEQRNKNNYMNFWKLGCRWGKKTEGKPLFFDLLIKENIVISWDHLDFGKDSIILLTDGFTPLGIARTLSTKRPIQELIDKETYFKEKQIYFEEGLVYYNASIIPIKKPTFTYDAQQGIIRISNTTTVKHITSFMDSLNQKTQIESYKKILEYKKQVILQGPPGTGKTKLAKEIAKEMLGLSDIKGIENNDQFKLIQFHPSYTYEDFVRGVVAKPNPEGEGIIYEAENKILAKFAKEALENYKDSQKDIESKERVIIKTKLERFIDHIQNILDGDESDAKESHPNKYMLTDNVYIFESDDKRFKYKGDNWLSHPKGLNMKYSEIEKIIASNVKERSDIKKISGLDSLTKSHATYFKEIIDKYDDFIKTEKVSDKSIEQKQILKNHVLIIDEINRANLSSVLGELIYALEYRGKSVESIYAVEENNELILPPNLYIIGTMNTADRSVGHIDYAIRRRFAFVDVLPKDLSEEEEITFDSKLFNSVQELFTTDNYKTHSNHLSTDFDPKEVALGHSYFIDKTDEGGSMSIRLEYEIKPILREYVKDGILKETVKAEIEKLTASI